MKFPMKEPTKPVNNPDRDRFAIVCVPTNNKILLVKNYNQILQSPLGVTLRGWSKTCWYYAKANNALHNYLLFTCAAIHSISVVGFPFSSTSEPSYSVWLWLACE